MADPTFRAKVRPELHPKAAELVDAYERVPGAVTYPGAMPEGLAAVLDHLLTVPITERRHLSDWADLLRGEAP